MWEGMESCGRGGCMRGVVCGGYGELWEGGCMRGVVCGGGCVGGGKCGDDFVNSVEGVARAVNIT